MLLRVLVEQGFVRNRRGSSVQDLQGFILRQPYAVDLLVDKGFCGA